MQIIFKVLILTILISSTCLLSFSQSLSLGDQEKRDKDKLIKETLLSFYTEYITQCDRSNYDTLMSSRERYCTKKLLNRIYNSNNREILDFDPFLQAQDCDKSTIQTLRVWNDNIKPNLYFISYEWPNSREKKTIRTIIKYERTYKIDSLPDLD